MFNISTEIHLCFSRLERTHPRVLWAITTLRMNGKDDTERDNMAIEENSYFLSSSKPPLQCLTK
jgi:hypothetical protein